MTELRGVGASPGIAIGPAWVLRDALEVPDEHDGDVAAALADLAEGLAAAAADLGARAAQVGGEAGEILEAQATMAADPELAEGAAAAVRGGTHPARAVIETGEGYAEALAASQSEYMAARADDVRDVSRRVARRLLGVPDPDLGAIAQPSVVVAEDLSPAETAGVDPRTVLGIATVQGSRTSHTAILARALGVPAVVAVSGLLEAVSAGESVGIDGTEGTVAVHLDDEETAVRRRRAEAVDRRRAALRAAAGDEPGGTADGPRVELAANVGTLGEVQAAVEAGAEGVGLLRTELAFLDRRDPPSEDEQAESLIAMVRALDGRRLVVRTFDFGADKPVPFLDPPVSPNPALGVRGIRLARLHPELLSTQLRAVARAAAEGPVAVMAPMVATVEEARWFAEAVREAAGSTPVEIGVMVETPAAALAPDGIAEAVDFLSIGTNDLVQYVNAADRQEGHLAHLQDPFAPPVLVAVDRICRAAAAAGAWVGVCGEAGGDPAWGLLAVGLGVTELSMGASSLLEVRAALAGVDLAACQDAARRALAAPDAEAARAVAKGVLP